MQTLSAVKISFPSEGGLSQALSYTIAWLQLSFVVDVKQVDISNPQFSSSDFVLLLLLYCFGTLMILFSFLNSFEREAKLHRKTSPQSKMNKS